MFLMYIVKFSCRVFSRLLWKLLFVNSAPPQKNTNKKQQQRNSENNIDNLMII